MTDYDFTFTVFLIGDSSSGKEILIRRYVSGVFDEDLNLTIGVNFYSKNTVYKGKNVKLQIWVFGGEERFNFLLSQYCRSANGALIIFDIMNAKTLGRVSEWTKTVRKSAGDIPIMLVGNENDLNKPREVLRVEGEKLVKRYMLSKYIEISMKTGKGIDRLFEDLTELLFEVTV